MKTTPATLPPLKLYLGDLPNTPLGDFRFAASDLGLVALQWAECRPKLNAYLQKRALFGEESPQKLTPYFKELSQYLQGKRTAFTIPIDWTHFTPFQRVVLQAVFRIPYGETRTYIDIAREVGRPHAYRAVGAANAMNPMPIVIPCHRVLGADGKLHGYGGGGGLTTKEWLLTLEGVMMA